MSKPLSFFLLEEDRFRDLDRKFTGCTRRKSVRKEEIQPFIPTGCSKAAPGCYCCFAEFFQSRACSEHTTPHLGSFETHSLGEGRQVLCHVFIHNIQGQRLPDLLDGAPAQLGDMGTPVSAQSHPAKGHPGGPGAHQGHVTPVLHGTSTSGGRCGQPSPPQGTAASSAPTLAS